MNKIIILCFVLLNQESLCLELMNDNLENDLIKSIAELGSFIISNYFNHSRCLILVTENDYVGELILKQITIIFNGYFFKIPSSSPGEISDLESFVELTEHAIEEACFGLILIAQDPNSYLDIFFRASKSALVRGEVTILHLPTPNQQIQMWSPEVWSSLAGRTFPRIVCSRLIHQDIHLVTHRFSGLNDSEEILLAQWQNSTQLIPSYVNLYRDKTKKLNGKKLRASIFDYKPNVVIYQTPEEFIQHPHNVTSLNFSANELKLDGIEYYVLYSYAEHHNATLTFCLEPELWGNILPNGSASGSLGRVGKDEAEFGTGAIYLWFPQWLRLEYSVPFTVAGLGILAPRPQTVSPWLLIIVPFTKEMWIAVGLTLIFGTFALYLASRRPVFPVAGLYGTWSRSLLAVWGMVIGQSPPQARGALGDKEDGLTAQLINIFLLSCLLVSSSYSGGLSSVLTLIRFEPPIENAHDLVDSKVPWVADDEAWNLTFVNSDNDFFKKVARQFHVLPPDEIQRRARLRQIAVLVERITGDHFALNEYVTEEMVRYLRIMKEDIVKSYEVIMLRKFSPYLFYLNQVMSRLWEGGIYLYASQVTVLRTMRTRLQLAIRNSQNIEQPKETPLRMEHIQAALGLLFLGLIASCLMFLYEISIGKPKRKIPQKYPHTK